MPWWCPQSVLPEVKLLSLSPSFSLSLFSVAISLRLSLSISLFSPYHHSSLSPSPSLYPYFSSFLSLHLYHFFCLPLWITISLYLSVPLLISLQPPVSPFHRLSPSLRVTLSSSLSIPPYHSLSIPLCHSYHFSPSLCITITLYLSPSLYLFASLFLSIPQPSQSDSHQRGRGGRITQTYQHAAIQTPGSAVI